MVGPLLDVAMLQAYTLVYLDARRPWTTRVTICILWLLVCPIMNMHTAVARDMFGRNISKKLSLYTPPESKIQSAALAYRLYHDLKYDHHREVRL